MPCGRKSAIANSLSMSKLLMPTRRLLNTNSFSTSKLLVPTRRPSHRDVTKTLFLWLCHNHLHIQLAHQTLRNQQREANLTCLHYKDECCALVALANANHHQSAVVSIRVQSIHNTAAIDERFHDCCQSFNDILQAFVNYCQLIDDTICQISGIGIG